MVEIQSASNSMAKRNWQIWTLSPSIWFEVIHLETWIVMKTSNQELWIRGLLVSIFVAIFSKTLGQFSRLMPNAQVSSNFVLIFSKILRAFKSVWLWSRYLVKVFEYDQNQDSEIELVECGQMWVDVCQWASIQVFQNREVCQKSGKKLQMPCMDGPLQSVQSFLTAL